MSRNGFVLVCSLFIAALTLSGCGGTVQSASVAVTPSSATVDGADAATLTATVTNDKNAAGVSWTVSGGGTLSNTSISSATYTAPAATASALTVTVTATSIADTTKLGTATITVPAAPAITTTGTNLAASVGAAYSVQLAGSGGVSPYTWTVTAGTLPPCLSMSTGGLITGTVTAACAGTYSPVLTMTDSGTPTKLSITGTLNMTLAAAPAINFTGVMPGTGTYNLAYAGSAAATGGAGTLTYSLNSGALPTGAGLNAANGAVSGTITAAGTFNFSIKAADAFGDSKVQAYQVVVGYPAVAIVPGAGSLPLAVTTQTYSQALTASGGSGAGYVWNVLGLSNGLTSSANGATLTINGPATSTGPVNFTASVTDGASNSAGPNSYSIQVYSPVTLPTTIPGSLPSTATANLAYSGSVTASGGSGNYSWTVTGQSDGITTSSSGGTLTVSGTPTSAATVSLNVSVKDTTTGVTAGPFTYAITVYSTVTLPSPNPATLGPAIVSTPYTGTIVAAGGSGNYTWTVTGLPSGGLNYSATGGTLTISGTPGSTSPVSFGVSIKDNTTNTTVGPFTYSVTAYNALTLPAPNPVSLASTATTNVAYSGTVTASGGSGTGYTYTVTGLPANGLNYSTTAGVLTISGTPTTTTAVSFGVSVKDSAGLTAGPVTYTITPYNALALPAPNPSTLGPATLSLAYAGTIVASGGSGNYTWTVTGLPSDSLNYSATGGTLTISGTPGSATTVSFGVSVKDNTTNVTVGPFTYSVTVYNSVTLPAPNPSSLGPADANSSYSGTITAAGGSGNYSWTVSGLSDGLNYATSGGTLTVSGTPTTSTTVSFNVSVKDTSTNTTVGPYTYTITVNSALTLPTPDPSSLPSTGYTSVAYTGTIVATGGSGNYAWQVTGLSDNLSPSPVGNTLTISGTPGASPATVTFNVKVTDSTTGNSFTQNAYTITISTPTAVSLPTPGTTVPGSATVNQNYNGSITVTGGVSPYTWSINGTTVTGGGLALSNGLSASSTGGSSLTITGTPTTLTAVPLTNVKVQDSIGSNQTNSYSIAVNSAGTNVSGQIFLNSNCGPGGTVPTITLNLLTNPGGTVVQTQTTNSSGSYTFTAIPNGNYTISPSITGPSSVFSPANTNVTVNNTTVAGENFQVSLGYTVSGTVIYTGSNTGRIYLSLNSSSCSGNGGTGTSIAAPGAFTIRGVPPGSYNLQAYMDLAALGSGSPNTSDPTGSTSGLTISNANLTGETITLTDNTPTAVPSANPKINSITPTDQGVAISYKAVTTTVNGNQIEAATSYDVQFSTSSTFATSPVTHNFTAIGAHGANVWILNNGISGVSGNPLINGTPFYFQVRARNSVGPASGWTVYGGGTPTSVTPGASTTGIQVQGTVTVPSGVTPTGPMYVGFVNENTNTIYGTRIASPAAGANAYSVYVPSDSNLEYVNFAILDQNNNGLIDAGDVSNTGDLNNAPAIAITAPLTGQNPSLPTANSTATVTTAYFQSTSSGGSSTGYNLNFNIRELNKLPVAVTLTSGPNMVNPVDLAGCTTCGTPQFNYSSSIGSAVPTVGDTYNFTVTYSDGSQDTGTTVNGKVTAFGSTVAIVGAADLATNLAPSANSSTSTTPTFTWTDPTGASTANYVYSFYISDNNGNTIWQLPNVSSNSSGFTYAQDPTATIVWGTDPIPGDNSSPSGSLNTSTQYSWQIQVQDSLGNSAQTQTWYKP